MPRPSERASSRKSKRAPARALPSARVPAAVRTLSEPRGTARFSAGKALCITAEHHPERVYPHFDAIAALLTSNSKVVRWNAMRILSFLARVDTARRIDAILDAYLAPIGAGSLISAANAIGGAGRIAQARPDRLDRIIPVLLSVERAAFETPECRNVAIGASLDALGTVWGAVRDRPDVKKFVRRQQSNSRRAVARRAAELALA